MKILKNKIGNVTKIYADTFEGLALEQIEKLINYEVYQNSKVRIMPDAHAGKGCTVGTTMTIVDKLTPNLVGVDIGCGMLSVKLEKQKIDFEKLDEAIRNNIPSGFDIHENIQRSFDFSALKCSQKVDLKRASLSIGSLGGGNHFIELGELENTGEMFLIIHSGSRKLGSEVCEYYQKIAIQHQERNLINKLMNQGRKTDIESALKNFKIRGTDKDLAYLSGDDFQNYLNDMAIVQKYASVNRETMADIIIKTMNLKEISRFQTIHNYIDFHRMILRKGAVSAEKGEMLLIPINMRDGSLLCMGKGNKDWNYSAPHGAGRLMSRSQAKAKLNMTDFKESMKGIFSTSVQIQTLDEAPQAYKSLDEISSLITETVDIVGIIKPAYNFKAH